MVLMSCFVSQNRISRQLLPASARRRQHRTPWLPFARPCTVQLQQLGEAKLPVLESLVYVLCRVSP